MTFYFQVIFSRLQFGLLDAKWTLARAHLGALESLKRALLRIANCCQKLRR